MISDIEEQTEWLRAAVVVSEEDGAEHIKSVPTEVLSALFSRADTLEAALAEAVGVLERVLARDACWAPSGMPNDCNCINLSRDAEREYETGTCPHQLARATLSKLSSLGVKT